MSNHHHHYNQFVQKFNDEYNDKLCQEQKELLNKCGLCLGLDNDLISAVIRWSVNQMEINRKLSQDLQRSIQGRDQIIEKQLFEN